MDIVSIGDVALFGFNNRGHIGDNNINVSNDDDSWDEPRGHRPRSNRYEGGRKGGKGGRGRCEN
jgi:hypothetical protein